MCDKSISAIPSTIEVATYQKKKKKKFRSYVNERVKANTVNIGPWIAIIDLGLGFRGEKLQIQT